MLRSPPVSLVLVAALMAAESREQENRSATETPLSVRWVVRIAPVDLGRRTRDEMPAEVVIDLNELRPEVAPAMSLDATSIRVVRTDSSGAPLRTKYEPDWGESLPFRWYDGSIPYDFPEFQDSVSRTAGALHPKPRERGGHYLNAIGDGRTGRLVWMHTQLGDEPAWYAIECGLLQPGEVPKRLPPQGWIGDGQARCAEVATQAVHSDHLRIDLDDWNGDGLVDLIAGDDFGHVVWWPNLGSKRSPRFEYCRLIFDCEGQPIDVGSCAAPKVCDWDADGDRDLLVGTERNRLVWFENIGVGRALLPVESEETGKSARPTEPRLKYRGLVMIDGKPLELPVQPLERGEPDIFKLDYYPVPEVVDWDGDGDLDLLAGGYITGCVFLYENVGAARGEPPRLVARGPLEADGRTLNVGHWCAAPCAVDLDADGDLDLLSGQLPFQEPGAKAGIRFFENVGTRAVPRLKIGELTTEQLWSIPLGTPRAADWDDDGDLDLAISVRTHIYLMENTGSKATPRFDGPPISILPTWGPAPVWADQLLDWNGDGRVDLVSNFTVRLNSGAKNPWDWPEQIHLLPPGVTIEHRSGRGDEEYSTVLDDFDRDGAIDILFGDWFGHVWLHRNRGTSAEPDFDLAGVKLSLQDGSPIKVGPIGLDPEKDFDALQGARTVIAPGDFDGDGRKDLVVGDTYGKLRYFRQLPDAARQAKDVPVFAPPIEFGNLGIRLNVCTTDWNQDGHLDCIAGSANGKVQVFLNLGGRANGPRDEPTSPFAAGFDPMLPPIMQPRVLLGDLNGDGDDDLYFPSTQGACFVERSFLKHGYARGIVVSRTALKR